MSLYSTHSISVGFNAGWATARNGAMICDDIETFICIYCFMSLCIITGVGNAAIVFLLILI